MSRDLKWLIAAALVNLISNSVGAFVAIRNQLPADFGGFLNGQDVVRDFVTINGTALSAPLPFLILQLVFIGLASRPARGGKIGVIGLTVVGFVYTLAQLGEPIILQQASPGGFDLIQACILIVNVASSVAMLILGIRVWRALRRADQNRSGVRVP